jgi:hypothetical protein
MEEMIDTGMVIAVSSSEKRLIRQTLYPEEWTGRA